MIRPIPNHDPQNKSNQASAAVSGYLAVAVSEYLAVVVSGYL